MAPAATLARMSLTCPRRTVAALMVAVSACVALPAAASAKKQDLKVMTRNMYLGADIIPLASSPDESSFEQAAAQRFQVVQNNNFPQRAKLLAAEIKKAKPDVVGLQEATTWRRGPDGDNTSPATQLYYDSTKTLLKALKKIKAPYKEIVGRDWFDFDAPTALGFHIRITQRDVVLVRKGSKVKVGKTFKGGFANHFDPPTVRGPAPELRGWVGFDGTLAKHKFRFVSTHLEAYSAAIADQQMQELLKKGGPLGSKKRASILVGDFNADASKPKSDSNPAYYTALGAGFKNGMPKRSTCCFAEDLHSTADHLDSWIDHIVTRPKAKVVKSGIVGTKQVGGIYPSDHAGVWATLRLKK
jgi:endonuclease/exonuclease/phosphatase family metal-dependent hydrolase